MAVCPRRSSTNSEESVEDQKFVETFEALAITSSAIEKDKFRGSDIPKRASMTVEFCGPRNTDYVVQFGKPGNHIPVIEIPVRKTTPTKTVALLVHGKDDVLMASVSGWSEVFSSTYEYLLDNLDWTKKVFDVCNAIDHVLELDWRDFRKGQKPIPGRYNACHAEKQLLAYIFYNPVKSIDLHLSSNPCSDCTKFIDRFCKTTSTITRIYVEGQMVNGVRPVRRRIQRTALNEVKA